MGFLVVEGAVIVAAGFGASKLMERRAQAVEARKKEWIEEVVDIESGDWKPLSEWTRQYSEKKKKKIPVELTDDPSDAFHARMQAKLLHFTMMRVQSGISSKLIDVVLEVTSISLSHSQTVATKQQQAGKVFASDLNFSKLLNTSSAIALSYRFDKKASQRQQFAFLRRKATDELTDLLIPTLMKVKESKQRKEERRRLDIDDSRTGEYKIDAADDDDNIVAQVAQDLKAMILSQKEFVRSLLEKKVDEALFQASASVDQGLDHVQQKAQTAVEESRLNEIHQLATATVSNCKPTIPPTLVSRQDQEEYARQAKVVLHEHNLTGLAQPLLSEDCPLSMQSQLLSNKKGQAFLQEGVSMAQRSARPFLDGKIQKAESIIESLVVDEQKNKDNARGQFEEEEEKKADIDVNYEGKDPISQSQPVSTRFGTELNAPPNVAKLNVSGDSVLNQSLNQTTTESLEKAHATLKHTKDTMLSTFQSQVKELVAIEMERLFQKIMKALDAIVFMIDKSLDSKTFLRELNGELDVQALKDKVFWLIEESHHGLVTEVSTQVQIFVDMMCGLLGLPPMSQEEDDDDDSSGEVDKLDFDEGQDQSSVAPHTNQLVITMTHSTPYVPYPRICPL
mmetsp:Transcript_18151/g.49545  ORF Transcript_18151/g.49545 Transcript_18151/m.49545 type:complete len:622 (-) Transcript_18151:493-2358(-)|eukprot:CAMPEP_0168726526 /NCGR_PEP_ID=MMETSP0724-20121128/4713_1 /TAXON_ID=265536 /ORGANISM="Amphiprora sp., Strain CCMP467" /LENGTH=621 /DNA_ID=CAMNT_0008773341 /DNA_START=215 /DNA_END=2080 /DNA_ORIENTATION=-